MFTLIPALLTLIVAVLAWTVVRFLKRAEDQRLIDMERAYLSLERSGDYEEGARLLVHQHHYIEVPHWVQYATRLVGGKGVTNTHAAIRSAVLDAKV